MALGLATAPEGHQRLAIERIQGRGVGITGRFTQQSRLAYTIATLRIELAGQLFDRSQSLVEQVAHLRRLLLIQLAERYRLAAKIRIPFDDITLGLLRLGVQGRRARRQVPAQDLREFAMTGQGICRATGLGGQAGDSLHGGQLPA